MASPLDSGGSSAAGEAFRVRPSQRLPWAWLPQSCRLPLGAPGGPIARAGRLAGYLQVFRVAAGTSPKLNFRSGSFEEKHELPLGRP
jgi:hypothetical protein